MKPNIPANPGLAAGEDRERLVRVSPRMDFRGKGSIILKRPANLLFFLSNDWLLSWEADERVPE